MFCFPQTITVWKTRTVVKVGLEEEDKTFYTLPSFYLSCNVIYEHSIKSATFIMNSKKEMSFTRCFHISCLLLDLKLKLKISIRSTTNNNRS